MWLDIEYVADINHFDKAGFVEFASHNHIRYHIWDTMVNTWHVDRLIRDFGALTILNLCLLNAVALPNEPVAVSDTTPQV